MKDSYSKLREQMVFNQLKSRGINDKKVLDAFLSVPREMFLPDSHKKFAYYDSAVPIGNNQTISQPYIVALMTQMLDLKENDVVLEIGSGSGYQGAIIAKIAKKVVSYEIIGELCSFAKKNLKKVNIKNVEIVCEDASLEIDDKEIFDKCIITAATKNISQKIIDSIKDNGLIVVPIGSSLDFQILRTYKKQNNTLKLVYEGIPVRFVPLRGDGGF
jgi:protein-L-isoaspartate(D-aspartate) O-methyltransferase